MAPACTTASRASGGVRVFGSVLVRAWVWLPGGLCVACFRALAARLARVVGKVLWCSCAVLGPLPGLRVGAGLGPLRALLLPTPVSLGSVLAGWCSSPSAFFRQRYWASGPPALSPACTPRLGYTARGALSMTVGCLICCRCCAPPRIVGHDGATTPARPPSSAQLLPGRGAGPPVVWLALAGTAYHCRPRRCVPPAVGLDGGRAPPVIPGPPAARIWAWRLPPWSRSTAPSGA